jgi:hypothetical protein
MAWRKLKRAFLQLLKLRESTMSESEQTWKEFKLVITNPPRYSGHFGIIKSRLVPFVEKNPFPFWITNYYNATSDFILFRVKCSRNQLESTKEFLNDLKRDGVIVDWQEGDWNPRDDAHNRIEGLRRLNFDPNTNAIVGYDGRILISPDTNVQERQRQLTALFETLGECTKVICRHLDSKPKDLWIMSVFVHLLLNSIDFSGPDPPSEEDSIRKIPPL